jgi:hypothetical protein
MPTDTFVHGTGTISLEHMSNCAQLPALGTPTIIHTAPNYKM